MNLDFILEQLSKDLPDEQREAFKAFKVQYTTYRKTLTSKQRDILDGRGDYSLLVERMFSVPDLCTNQVFLVDKTTLNALMMGIEQVVASPKGKGVQYDSAGETFLSNQFPNAIEALKSAGLSLLSLKNHGVNGLGIACGNVNEREHQLVKIVLPIAQLNSHKKLSNLDNILFKI